MFGLVLMLYLLTNPTKLNELRQPTPIQPIKMQEYNPFYVDPHYIDAPRNPNYEPDGL